MSNETETAHTLWHAPISKLEKSIEKHQEKFPAGAEQRELNRIKQKKKRLWIAMERVQQMYPSLYRGDTNVELSPQQVEQLFAEVCQEAGGYELRDIQNYLVVGLAKGISQLGWQMSVPAPMAISGVESSNATPEAFRLLEQYDALDKAFAAQLEVDPKNERPNPVQDAGELLFSLCFHSGICSMKWLRLVPEAIRTGAGTQGGFCWLELGKENNLENADYKDLRRRLSLAPVTQILLWRWYQRRGKNWPRDPKSLEYLRVDDLLRRFAKQLCKAAGLSSGMANRCLRLSEANLATQLPNTLVHYLRSNRAGTPLPEQNWHRLLTDRRGNTEKQTAIAEGRPVLNSNQVRVSTQFPDQKRLYGKLLKGIEGKPKTAGIEFTKNFMRGENVSPVLQLMASWAGHLLEHGGVVKASLTDSSVVRYLDWIKGILAYADDLHDPLNLDEDSWQAIYDEIIANAHGMISDCAGRLAAFHQYLVQAYGIPPVDVAGMSADRQVDARVLTPREYQRVREILQRRAPFNEMAECQELILILGYRLGLRRGEAYSRLFSDFAGLDDPSVERAELLVRPNKNARIKSETSTRRLPLSILLTEDELSTLRTFYLRRRSVIPGNAKTRPLFGDVAGSYWPAVTSRVFDLLTVVLQEVTGDANFRFHHLRHSFITFTLLRLLERTPGEFIPTAWRQDENRRDLLPSMGQCLWEQVRLPDMGQALWLLAMWAGHASPQVTLECYSHLLDWLVGCYLNQRHNPDLSISAQQTLLGKTPDALERYRHRKEFSRPPTPASELACALAERWPMVGRRKQPSLLEHAEPNDAGLDMGSKIGWMDAYNLQLWSIQTVKESGIEKPRGIRAAAELVGISLAQAEQWNVNATAIMSLTTNRARAPHNQSTLVSPTPRPKLSRGTNDVMRTLDEKDLARRMPELPGRFLAPPNTPNTRIHAEKYFNTLIEWYESDPENAGMCMRAALESSQRSKPEIRPRGAARQKLFFDLLQALGLKSRTTLAIKVAPETDRKKVKQFWSGYFGVSPSKIVCKEETLPLKLGVNGRCHISVESPPALNNSQNLFWSTLRFALLSAYVVCADEEKAE